MINQEGKFIHIKLKAGPLLVASLCVSQGNEVIILHASAALGKVKYSKDEGNQWKTSEKFEWHMRESAMD